MSPPVSISRDPSSVKKRPVAKANTLPPIFLASEEQQDIFLKMKSN